METLIIVRDDALRATLVELVRRRACEPAVYADGERALAQLVKDSFQCALVEVTREEDLDIVRRLRRIEHSDLLVLAITDSTHLHRALEAGATDFVRHAAAPDVLDARLKVMRLDVERRRQTHWHGVPFLSLVERTGDIFEVLTPSEVVLYINPAVERVMGFRREEVLGRRPSDVYGHDLHPPELFREIREVMDAGGTWRGVVKSRRRDGRIVQLECDFAAVFDDQGRLTHRIAVKRDITERLEREDALERANAALAEARDAALDASQAKSAFLANMSHELRTPLNAIIGYSEMLLEDARDAEEEDAVPDLERIKNAGTHLLGLINDVLDISKIEAGKMTLYLEPFDVAQLVDEVAHTIQPQAARQGNAFEVAVSEEVGVMVADLTKVRQILLNLLSNANKFTEKGLVRLSVHRDGLWITFKVRDTGIGIAESALPRLFTPFVQADTSTTRRFGGTGLGLAISQRFCQMMAGELTVKTALGEGSTFYARLPVEVPERQSTLRQTGSR